ncbi:MAG: 50S ribosomal protein L9 [Proteobacteria bacterium]|nr:50S ribosomal protein L9 [Pseudomonadota bacterium]MDA1132452.1 50S ribosomal protein L9 [Pseudomonadota bacterium]
MELILLERVEKLGQMGDVVRVKDGYARNYLLPRKKALRATAQNRTAFEARRGELEQANAGLRSDAETAARVLDGKVCVLLRQASDSGHLYGSVNARDIAAAAGKTGVAVDRQQVLIDRAIKALGVHPVRIRLHPEVLTMVNVIVARSEAEAEVQRDAFLRGQNAAVGAGTDEAEAAVGAESFFDDGAGPAAGDGDDADEDAAATS